MQVWSGAENSALQEYGVTSAVFPHTEIPNQQSVDFNMFCLNIL